MRSAKGLLRIAWAALLLIGSSIPQYAFAQEEINHRRFPVICGNYLDLKKELFDRYGEVPLMRGITAEDSLFQIFSSRDGTSFTVVEIEVAKTDQARACVLKAGHDLDRESPPHIEKPTSTPF